MSSNKKYWKSVEELDSNSSIVDALRQNEFVEKLPVDEFLGDEKVMEDSSTSRRDFLKFVGFTTASAALVACEGPVVKSVPYVVQPERIVPGIANYYATTIADGFDFASVLIKTREGRPIKVEPNKMSLKSGSGSVNARTHASVLSLYDDTRVKQPLAKGGDTQIAWSGLHSGVKQALDKADGKKVVLLTQTFASPSTAKLIKEFSAKYKNVSHVVYDAVSSSTALDAFEKVYGVRALSTYDFSKANVIVSVGADFLSDWQGGGYDGDYALNRIPKKGKMSKHIQVESNMSITGSNADVRIAVKPSVQKQALAFLYSKISKQSVSYKLSSDLQAKLTKVADELIKAGSTALLVSGIDDVDAQLLVLEINKLLKSQAFDPQRPRYIREGNDKQVKALISDMNAGKVSAILMAGVNPIYTLADTEGFKKGLEKVTTKVIYTTHLNDTAKLVDYIAPVPHYLEAWGDVAFCAGSYAFTQPTIRPLFDTCQFQESLLKLMDKDITYHEYLKDSWSSLLSVDQWNQALHDGLIQLDASKVNTAFGFAKSVAKSSFNAKSSASNLTGSSVDGKGSFELNLYTKVALGDGQQANNPWLQEMPDPISRASWDNYITISKSDADQLGLYNRNVADGALDGSYATLSLASGKTVTAPVLIQPGQAKGSLGLALGYGRTDLAKEQMHIGVNAYGLYENSQTFQSVSIAAANGNHEFACVQLHNTLMGRGDIIKETTLDEFNHKDKSHWNPMPQVSKDHMPFDVTSSEVDLWDEFDRSTGHHFNLSIDLNACTGCGACVIACHAENNVPVVGKSEVRKSRDMHWLRIDRYYSSEQSFLGDTDKKEHISGLSNSLSEFGELENPSDNPQVAFQPVMCQHCNHAPCETVCPVAATSHGRQGQNQMAYNRCVGTRYCANNCPYKVRRFNWFLYNNNDEFDFHMNNDMGRMVINPDVTVRSRGVMEKCSFCIQSTQKVILDAKLKGKQPTQEEFNDSCACASACESGAMVFGDINDKSSKIESLRTDDRAYHLLEHVGVKPNVVYQTKVRNV